MMVHNSIENVRNQIWIGLVHLENIQTSIGKEMELYQSLPRYRIILSIAGAWLFEKLSIWTPWISFSPIFLELWAFSACLFRRCTDGFTGNCTVAKSPAKILFLRVSVTTKLDIWNRLCLGYPPNPKQSYAKHLQHRSSRGLMLQFPNACSMHDQQYSKWKGMES